MRSGSLNKHRALIGGGSVGDSCKINHECPEWHNGAGSGVCYQCRELSKRASNGHETEPFYTDDMLIANIQDDSRIVSIFSVLRSFKARDRIIIEDNLLYSISPGDLAKEHGLSRQQVHRIIWQGRHDIKLQLGLSTVF